VVGQPHGLAPPLPRHRPGRPAPLPPPPGALLYGLASILLITPLAAPAMLALPLPPEMAVGLAVFCAVPTALSSGITFTQVGRGAGWVCGLGFVCVGCVSGVGPGDRGAPGRNARLLGAAPPPARPRALPPGIAVALQPLSWEPPCLARRAPTRP
jgi:hypothetical protein